MVEARPVDREASLCQLVDVRPPIFYGQPGASLFKVVAFWAIFYIWIGGEFWLGWKMRPPPGSKSQDRGSKVILIAGVWATVAAGISIGMAFPATAISGARDGIFVVGLLVMLVGLVLRWYSIFALGRSFTVDVATRPGQQVVASGPYRWVRHPSYTGGLLTVFGVLLCCVNWLSFFAFAIAIAGYAYRIRVEEAALAEGLGDEYRDYMRRTRRLIPFIV
jgi:protein-S-isoprenylcysteine O-methyltransferase Ste14